MDPPLIIETNVVQFASTFASIVSDIVLLLQQREYHFPICPMGTSVAFYPLRYRFPPTRSISSITSRSSRNSTASGLQKRLDTGTESCCDWYALRFAPQPCSSDFIEVCYLQTTILGNSLQRIKPRWQHGGGALIWNILSRYPDLRHKELFQI